MEERAKRKRIRNLTPANLKRARTMRRDMTASEEFLWSFIKRKKLGFLFRRQYTLDKYYLDFYCPEAKLCVEVDGELHRLRRRADALRDADLASFGIATLRVPSLEIFQKTGGNVDPWLEQIVRLCQERSGRQVKLF